MTDMSFSVQLQLVEHLLLTVCTSFPATLTEIGKPNSGSLARMEKLRMPGLPRHCEP